MGIIGLLVIANVWFVTKLIGGIVLWKAPYDFLVLLCNGDVVKL